MPNVAPAFSLSSVSHRLPIILACLLLSAAASRAALGETQAELQKRFGRPDPLLQQASQKNVTVWSIETDQSERLIYTVTFNAKGLSIAEGLKPVGRAVLHDLIVQSFVDSQLAMHRDTTGTRMPKPGEKYRFAGQEFVCAANESVWVDETNDFMILWAKGKQSLAMAVRAEMLAPAR